MVPTPWVCGHFRLPPSSPRSVDFNKEVTLDVLMSFMGTTGFQSTNLGLAVEEVNRMVWVEREPTGRVPYTLLFAILLAMLAHSHKPSHGHVGCFMAPNSCCMAVLGGMLWGAEGGLNAS